MKEYKLIFAAVVMIAFQPNLYAEDKGNSAIKAEELLKKHMEGVKDKPQMRPDPLKIKLDTENDESGQGGRDKNQTELFKKSKIKEAAEKNEEPYSDPIGDILKIVAPFLMIGMTVGSAIVYEKTGMKISLIAAIFFGLVTAFYMLSLNGALDSKKSSHKSRNASTSDPSEASKVKSSASETLDEHKEMEFQSLPGEDNDRDKD